MNKKFLPRSVLIIKQGERIIIKKRNISKKSSNRVVASYGTHHSRVARVKDHLNRRGRSDITTISTTSTGPRDPITE